MLWKNLARVISNYAVKHPEHAGVRLIQAKAQAANKTLLDWLQQDYDIRGVGNLRQAVREAFPKPLKHENLWAGENVRGQWQVLPMSKVIQGRKASLAIVDDVSQALEATPTGRLVDRKAEMRAKTVEAVQDFSRLLNR